MFWRSVAVEPCTAVGKKDFGASVEYATCLCGEFVYKIIRNPQMHGISY